MRLLPEHPITRAAAAIWMLACFALLVATLLQADLYANERRALKLLVPVYLLSLPSAHLAFAAVSKVKLTLYLDTGLVPALPWEAVALWTLTAVLGYVQWFIALPWLAQRCRLWCSAISGYRRTSRQDPNSGAKTH